MYQQKLAWKGAIKEFSSCLLSHHVEYYEFECSSCKASSVLLSYDNAKPE